MFDVQKCEDVANQLFSDKNQLEEIISEFKDGADDNFISIKNSQTSYYKVSIV